MGAQGTATLDFGAFPGTTDTTVTVTGQATILAGSLVEAWIMPTATADHTADEHLLEELRVSAGNVVAGTGFTIYGFADARLAEPLESPGISRFRAGGVGLVQGDAGPSVGGRWHRIYGQFTVGWVWN